MVISILPGTPALNYANVPLSIQPDASADSYLLYRYNIP